MKIYTEGVFTVTEDYNKLIGTRVKMLRITKGVSQTELAKQIGVTQTHLSNIENGRAGLTIPNLIKLHEALDTPMSRRLRPPVFLCLEALYRPLLKVCDLL